MIKKISNAECVDMMISLQPGESFDICTEADGSHTYQIIHLSIAEGLYYMILYYGGGSSDLIDITRVERCEYKNFLSKKMNAIWEDIGINTVYLKKADEKERH